MSARTRRFSVVLILVTCLAGPVAEMFDRWAHTVQDGNDNDTEADVVIVALCVGVARAPDPDIRPPTILRV